MDIANWIERLISRHDAQETIEHFDAVFDVSLQHDPCIALLERIGAYDSSPLDDIAALSRYVGAYWCRMIQADVSYDLSTGARLIHASRTAADRLREKVAQTRRMRTSLGFPTYVAARWQDGAGKIRFRRGKYAEARIHFDQGRNLAEDADLWYCLPDLRSNCIRGKLDEVCRFETAKADIQRHLAYEQYADAWTKAVLEADARGIAVPDGTVPVNSQLLSNRKAREFLRGLSSILHNMSQVAEIQESFSLSRASEAICRFLNDDYRLGQAILQQAKLAEARGDRDEAERLLMDIVTSSKWQRGRPLAQQNVLRLRGTDNRTLDRFGCAMKLVEMLNDLRSKPDVEAVDADFHYFTVDSLAKVVQRVGLDKQQRPEVVHDLQREHRRQELAMVLAAGGVVQLTKHKNGFSERYYPIFLDHIAERISVLPVCSGAGCWSHTDRTNQEQLDEAVFLVEEASCRELLDLLIHAHRHHP